MINKSDLRRSLLAKRSAIHPDSRAQWNARIAAQLLAWWETQRVQEIGIYWPIRNEPDIRAAYSDLAARGVQMALPLVVKQNAPLEFAAWKPGDAMVGDSYGILTPEVQARVQPQTLLIPCVGFNSARFRLGYGGGFYDRTLAGIPRPQAIGIAYSCLLADFEAATHDVALDAIITENGIL